MSISRPAQRRAAPARKSADGDEDLATRERFIVLLRHGIAEERTPGKGDEERALTAEGHARMKQIARGLERALPKTQAVYSSSLVRAVQTALWVSKAYRSRVSVETAAALSPEASVDDFLKFVADIKQRRIVLVGHEPNLTRALRALVGLPERQPLELKKGGCYGVRLLADGSAAIEWVIPPRILRKLGEAE